MTAKFSFNKVKYTRPSKEWALIEGDGRLLEKTLDVD